MSRLKTATIVCLVCLSLTMLTGSPAWLLLSMLTGAYIGIRKARLDTGAVEV